MNGLNDDEKNVIMSMALSHAYSNTSLKKGKIADFYNYATSKPDPLNQNNLLFSKNDLSTYYDSKCESYRNQNQSDSMVLMDIILLLVLVQIKQRSSMKQETSQVKQ